MQKDFLKDVKHNCDISDALHWGYFSVCGLLMRYRDLYRSEQGAAPWAPLRREEIGSWISAKEARWPDLEKEQLTEIRLNGAAHTAFDIAQINEVLVPDGHVYGAGYGIYLKPTFFVGEVVSVTEAGGHTVYTTDRELVRDLFTAPAMLQGRTIFLRMDPLRALLWDKFLQIRPGTVLADAFAAQGLRPGQPVNDGFTKKLDGMVRSCLASLLLHELAESRERLLTWPDIILMADDRGAEHFLRAVQDLVADTADNGPLAALIDARDAAGLLLYAGLLEGYRRLLFSAMTDALIRFRDERSWPAMDNVRREGAARFLALRKNVLDLYRQGDRDLLVSGIRELSQAGSPPSPSAEI